MGEVVSRVGVGGLTLARVGRHSGITASALVQRWGSRRRLLLAYAERAVAEAADFLSPPPARGLLLAGLIEDLAGQVSDRSTPGEIANHLSFLQLDLTDPDFGVLAASHARAVRQAILGRLREAAVRGEVATEGLEELGTTLQVVYNGAVVTWAIDPVTESVREHVRNRLWAVLRMGSVLPNPAGGNQPTNSSR